VAVYYDAPSSNFTGFSASTASGGGCGTQCTSATASPGSNGTSAFFDTSATNNNLAIYQNFTIPAGGSPTYNTVNVQPGALLTIGGGTTLTVTNALAVSGTVVAQSANNTAQVNGVWAGSGVAITAGSITVNSAGSLNADTQGYVAGAGPGGSPAGTSAGGSYGGLGGVGDGASPSPTYGSKMLPVDLGSGGGSRCCGTIPGAGGGDLLLTVSGVLTDDGVISANGGDGTGLQVGGGSGGSVNIHTTTLAGSGSIAANGGSGGEAGGGGGRVALYFTSANNFNLTLATATGGSSDGGNAGAMGTVYIPGGQVTKASSTTALSVSPTQLNAGQAETFQAVVTAATGGPTPTGNVSFFDGTNLVGTQVLSASQQSGTATAQFQTTVLTVGTHSITASYGGDGNVDASTSPAQMVTVSLDPTTSTLALSAATLAVGQTEMLTATIAGGTGSPAMTGTVNFFDTTASTSLSTVAVTSTSTGGSAVLAVSNLTVGTHVLNARYSGDANYQASTSPNQTVVVTTKAQTITFAPIPDHQFGDPPFTLNATASSGLPVSYAVTSGPATVSGNVVTITGAGTVGIQATQAGNATTFAAATPVTQSFTVAKATQTISFAPIPNHTAGDPAFQLNATASSGLAISYAVNSGPATIAGNLVTLTGAGTVQIQATQAGNTNFAAATPVNQSFTVSLQSQTITFPSIPNHTLGDAPFTLSATASSGLAVTYSVISGPATVSASTVTLTGAGTVVIQAAQAGNTTYAAATSVTQTFTVSPPAPTLASITPAGGVIGSGATTITLTGANFVSTDTVQLNGAAIATNFASSTTLTAIVPASFLAATGTGQITVFDSVTKSTTAAQSFSVFAAPDINFSGPPTAAPASQPSLTFQLVNPYPFPIAGSLNLAFTPSVTNAVDDPAVQFSTGGRTQLYTIPALSQVTPTVQIQSGTVAGVATVTLVVTSNGVNVTPANVVPVEITIPPAVPMITTAALTRSGTTLVVAVHGFSNTREVSTARFHFTAAPGNSVSTPDITLPATTIFADYFTSSVSAPYGSTFVYTQDFTLNDDASSIQNVTVTLVNSVGDSVQVTTQ
jgi:hypothetical protein